MHQVKVGVVSFRRSKVDEIWQLASDLAEARLRLGRAGRPRGVGSQPRSRQGAAAAAAATHDAQRKNFTTRVEKIFRLFQREVLDAVKDQGWDGNDDMDKTRLQWSFAGALLYAVTVTTTIGMQFLP